MAMTMAVGGPRAARAAVAVAVSASAVGATMVACVWQRSSRVQGAPSHTVFLLLLPLRGQGCPLTGSSSDGIQVVCCVQPSITFGPKLVVNKHRDARVATRLLHGTDWWWQLHPGHGAACATGTSCRNRGA